MKEDSAHKLTIAFDAKRAYLNYRGLGNYSRNLLAQLAHYDSEARYLLCTPQDKGLFPQLNREPFERIMPQGLWNLVPSVWRRMGIPAALRDKHVDIYHGLSQELPEGIERLGCKTVVTMHDAIFMRYPQLYSAAYRHSFIRRNESACRRADLIIAISEQTKRDFMSFFNVEEERIRVVYQGCNERYWLPVSEAQQHEVAETYQLPKAFVLSVGALEERKNQVRLIEAMADARIDLPLVLVGRGNAQQVQRLRQTAQQKGVQLQIIDNVRTEHLPAIYHAAAVFAYPSLFEGFGIPILEAARCGTPIVTGSGICFEEIAGKGALYVNPTDAGAIGEALRITLLNDCQTQQRVEQAKTNTEKFRAEKIAQSMMTAYSSLL